MCVVLVGIFTVLVGMFNRDVLCLAGMFRRDVAQLQLC